MTKRKWSIKWSLISVSVLTAGLLLTSLVSARPGHFGRGGPHLFPFRVLQHLDLTDTQQAQIDAIKTAHRENLIGLKTELKETRQEVLDLLLGDAEVEAADFTTLQADLAQIRATLFEEFLEVGLAIRAELTPAQRAEAATWIEEVRARRAEKRAEWRARRDKER